MTKLANYLHDQDKSHNLLFSIIMEFDRSQIFAPVKADTVPRFAQRPRPAAPGLLDQLPSTDIGQPKNNDRLRILVRGIPDYVSSEEVEKHLIKPFQELVDSWYLIRQDFVGGLDLDLDQESLTESCTRVYVQLHNREGVQKFHASVNGDFVIAKNWSQSPDEKSDTETISDNIPTPLKVEYSPLYYFTPDPTTTDIMAGTIESDPLYIKFCENPDQLLFEGGEGRILEPVIAPTDFEVDSIVPVGVPLAKIDIPEEERVTLPEEKKSNKKKTKKGNKDKEKKLGPTDDSKRDSKHKEKDSTRVTSDDSSRESTPSEDKKKKRSRKKKLVTSEGANGTAPPSAPSAGTRETSDSVPSNVEPPLPSVAISTTGAAPNNSNSTTSTQGKSKTKKKRVREPKDSRNSRESPAPREPSRESLTPRELGDSTPKDLRDTQTNRKQKKKSDKPKKDSKAEANDSKPEPRLKQQPGKENQSKSKPRSQPQSQPAVDIPQTTNQSAAIQNGNERAPPKKKRTRTKRPAANGAAATPSDKASSAPAPQ